MSDIVALLREGIGIADNIPDCEAVMDAAADEIERLKAVVEKGEYLAQAAGRAMRDHGGAQKFLDLNAAITEFRTTMERK
jgi:hypothetical protein